MVRAVPTLSALPADVTDERLLQGVAEDQRDSVLRAVFDNSRQLALSAVRFLGSTWEVSDFRYVLADASPCLTGAWTEPSPAIGVLTRNGCEAVRTCGSLACDYWREAIDGLTTGAGATERFARHASVGHRDGACIDVWFDDPSGTPDIATRWAPVPPEVVAGMETVVGEVTRGHAVLTLLGVAEGSLYYRLEAAKGSTVCGSASQIWHRRIATAAKSMHLTVKDVSPTAVLRQEL